MKKKIEQARGRRQTQQDNLRRAAAQKKEALDERELDIYLLRKQQEKDRMEIATEEENKARNQQAQRDFQANLIELAKKEAIDDSANEAHRKAEEDKEWKKKEDRWAMESENRRLLMEEVARTRKIQIESREEEKRRQKEANRLWALQAAKEAKIQEDQEREKRIQKRQYLRRGQKDLMAQIEEKQYYAEKEKQDERLDNLRAKRYSERFQKSVEQMRVDFRSLGASSMQNNFHRKNTDW